MYVINAGPQINAGSLCSGRGAKQTGPRVHLWVWRYASLVSVSGTYTMAQQRKRCSYDLSFKLKVIESAEKTSKEAAARQLNIKRRPRFNAGPVLTPGQRTLLINKRPGV